MRPLTSTLRAAQEAASALPVLRVDLLDRDVGVVPLRWTRWYSGSEPDGPAAAAVPSDGALVRARIDPGAGTLHVQRVATPTASSDYTPWTALGSVAASAGLDCSAALQRLLLTSVNSVGTGVEVRESTDGGATWAAATVVATAAATITAVAGAVRADGSAAVFFAVGGVVSSVTRTGLGGWGLPVAWSHSRASVDGLVASDAEDYVVLVSGTDNGGNAGVWAALFGSGLTLPPGVWFPLAPIALASAGTGIAYLAAGVAIGSSPWASIVERSQGDRVQLASTVAGLDVLQQSWRDPQPLDETTPFGLAIAIGGTASYLAAPAGVWSAAPSEPAVNVSADVLTMDFATVDSVQRARLALSDADGRYLEGVAPPTLAPGAELLVRAGHRTSAGLELVEVGRLTITSIARSRRRGRSIVEIEATGPLGVLGR